MALSEGAPKIGQDMAAAVEQHPLIQRLITLGRDLTPEEKIGQEVMQSASYNDAPMEGPEAVLNYQPNEKKTGRCFPIEPLDKRRQGLEIILKKRKIGSFKFKLFDDVGRVIGIMPLWVLKGQNNSCLELENPKVWKQYLQDTRAKRPEKIIIRDDIYGAVVLGWTAVGYPQGELIRVDEKRLTPGTPGPDIFTFLQSPPRKLESSGEFKRALKILQRIKHGTGNTERFLRKVGIVDSGATPLPKTTFDGLTPQERESLRIGRFLDRCRQKIAKKDHLVEAVRVKKEILLKREEKKKRKKEIVFEMNALQRELQILRTPKRKLLLQKLQTEAKQRRRNERKWAKRARQAVFELDWSREVSQGIIE